MRSEANLSGAARITIEQATTEDDAGYLRFARASFGASAYQANPRYLPWLYEHSPFSRGRGRDMWIARDDDGIIRGCIHQLRLPWSVGGEVVIVPALHNTMMEPTHRGVAGGMLILQAMKGEAHVFVPGAEGAVAEALRQLRFQTVASTVLRRVLRPVAAMGSVLAERLGMAATPVTVIDRALRAAGAVVPMSSGELVGLVDLANREAAVGFRPWWTVEAMWWRFFHTAGPFSALWLEGSFAAPQAFAIVSLGRRRGVVIARVLCSAAIKPQGHAQVLERAAQGARALGAQAIQFTSGGELTPDLPGWRPVPDAAQTLIFHRAPAPEPDRFCAGVGDYGLEALLTIR